MPIDQLSPEYEEPEDYNGPVEVCDFPGCTDIVTAESGSMGPDFSFCQVHHTPGIIR